MESHDKTFNTICRICLNHGKADKMVSLIANFDTNDLSPYGILFEKLTQITVKQNDYLPTKICQKCKKCLEKVDKFMITSEKSDKKLAKLINFSLKQDLGGEMVKEVVRQYTLFSQNFPDDSKVSYMQPSTSQYGVDVLSNSEEQLAKIERKYPKIKVEVDVQQIDSESDIENDNESIENINKTHRNISKGESDNVDIFLYSIEKLITTKIEDVERRTSEKIRPKKDLKGKVSEQNFTCNVCHRVLANPLTYKHHMERHGVCRYVCDQCGKGFPVLAELTQHQIYRHGIGSTFECDQCSFKAARRLELIEHIRLHTGERPFTCEMCGLTFRRTAIYRNHLKSHGEKTVQCDYCPRKFIRRSAMLAHTNNVHDRVYVFLCRICNVTYAMAKTVRRHMLVKHGIPRNKQGKVIRINKPADSVDSNFFQKHTENISKFTDL